MQTTIVPAGTEPNPQSGHLQMGQPPNAVPQVDLVTLRPLTGEATVPGAAAVTDKLTKAHGPAKIGVVPQNVMAEAPEQKQNHEYEKLLFLAKAATSGRNDYRQDDAIKELLPVFYSRLSRPAWRFAGGGTAQRNYLIEDLIKNTATEIVLKGLPNFKPEKGNFWTWFQSTARRIMVHQWCGLHGISAAYNRLARKAFAARAELKKDNPDEDPSYQEIASRIDKNDGTAEKVEKKLGRTPTESELKDALLTAEKVQSAMLAHEFAFNQRSLDEMHEAEQQQDETKRRRTPPELTTSAAHGSQANRGVRLYEAIQKLDPASQQVIILHDDEGRSLREIAESLGTTEDAVKKRHERAKRKLLKLLDDQEKTRF